MHSVPPTTAVEERNKRRTSKRWLKSITRSSRPLRNQPNHRGNVTQDVSQRRYQSSSTSTSTGTVRPNALRSTNSTNVTGGGGSGSAGRWASRGNSTSCASTLVAGISPWPTPSAAGTTLVNNDPDGTARQQPADHASEDDVETPAALLAGGNSGWDGGRRSVAAAVSRIEESGATGRPAPLDLSSLPGPTAPSRRKSDTSAASTASSNAVVLQGAALESLQRLGRRGSSSVSDREGGVSAVEAYRRRASGGGGKGNASGEQNLLLGSMSQPQSQDADFSSAMNRGATVKGGQGGDKRAVPTARSEPAVSSSSRPAASPAEGMAARRTVEVGYWRCKLNTPIRFLLLLRGRVLSLLGLAEGMSAGRIFALVVTLS